MNVKIAAIGEILFDVYPNYKKLGGAPFNFLYHIWKLTGNGKFISSVGKDDEGNEILHELQKRNFDVSEIQIDDTYPTGLVEVNLDENKVPEFNILENRAYDFISINSNFTQIVESSDLFYFGTLAQRNDVTRGTIESLANINTKNFCDLNIRQNFYNKEIINNSLVNSNVLKLNFEELELVNKLLLGDEFQFEKTAFTVTEKFEIDLLCITLGEKGAYLFKGDEKSHYKESVDKIVDTVGAGDAYASILAIGYLLGWKLSRINELASKFSAEICTIEGAIPGDDNFYNKYIERMKNE